MGAPPDTLYMLSNQGTLPKIDTETGIEYDTSKLPGRFLRHKKT